MDLDAAGFEGLTQGIECVRAVLARLVEKQHPTARAGNRPGPHGAAPASDERRDTRAVVRRFERCDAAETRDRQPRERAQRRRLHRRVVVEVGKDAGKPPREHRLARTGRPAHEQMVPARGRDDEGIDRVALADDVFEVGRRLIARFTARRERHGIDLDVLDVEPVAAHDVAKRRGAEHLDARHEPRLGGVRVRHDDAPHPRAGRGGDGGQHTGHGPQATVETQFAHMRGLQQRRGIHRRFGRKSGDRDREIEARAVLGQARGREVDGELATRQRQVAVRARIVHPLMRLAHGLVGEADDHEGGRLVRQVGFDLDEISVQAREHDAPRAPDGHRRSSRCSSTAVAGSSPVIPTTSTRSRRCREASGWAAAHAYDSRQSRSRLRWSTASNGCP